LDALLKSYTDEDKEKFRKGNVKSGRERAAANKSYKTYAVL